MKSRYHHYRLVLIGPDGTREAGRITAYPEPPNGKWAWFLTSSEGVNVTGSAGRHFNSSERAIEDCGRKLQPPEGSHFEAYPID